MSVRKVYALFIFLIASVVYLNTLSPSIAGGDSGEIVAEGCEWGIAHPPGYPLITMIIGILKFISHQSTNIISVPFFKQIASFASLVNVTSAIFSSLAVYFMALSIMHSTTSFSRETDDQLADVVFTCSLLSFHPLFWQYALTAEVFALNNLLVAIIFYLTVKISATNDVSTKINLTLWGSFICGLALCNQHTIILLEFPLIVWVLFVIRNEIRVKPLRLLYFLLFFILGLWPYIYLPLSAKYNPTPGSWGDITTMQGFLHHFLRRDYGTLKLYSGLKVGQITEGVIERSLAFLNDFAQSNVMGNVVFVFALISIIPVRFTSIIANQQNNTVKGQPIKTKSIEHKNEPKVNQNSINESSQSYIGLLPYVIAASLVFYLGVFHSLSNLPLADRLLFDIHRRFWMQPNFLLTYLIGIGFNKAKKFLLTFSHRYSLVMMTEIFLLTLTITFAYFQYKVHLGMSDQSDNYHFRSYARAILSPLPPNALLVINYDQQWTSVRYIQRCESFRSDVTVVNLSMMTYHWFSNKRKLFQNVKFPGLYHAAPGSLAVQKKQAFTFLSFLKENINENKIFLSGKLSFPDPDISKLYDSVPVGLTTQFIPLKKSPNGTIYSQRTLQYLSKTLKSLNELPSEDKYPDHTWEWTIGRDFKDRLTETGAHALQTAIDVAGSDPFPLIFAVYLLESCLYLELPHPPSSALLKNAGLAHVHLLQNKILSSSKSQTLPFKSEHDILRLKDEILWPNSSSKWVEWSSTQFINHWGEFLSRDEAKKDFQFATIKDLYDKAIDAFQTSKSSSTSSSNSNSGNKKHAVKAKEKRKKIKNKKKVFKWGEL